MCPLPSESAINGTRTSISKGILLQSACQAHTRLSLIRRTKFPSRSPTRTTPKIVSLKPTDPLSGQTEPYFLQVATAHDQRVPRNLGLQPRLSQYPYRFHGVTPPQRHSGWRHSPRHHFWISFISFLFGRYMSSLQSNAIPQLDILMLPLYHRSTEITPAEHHHPAASGPVRLCD